MTVKKTAETPDQPQPAVETPAATQTDDTETPAGDQLGDADRVAELERENEALRAKLASAGVSVDDPRKPEEPSYGISEGTRDELERHGKATSPFTGKPLSRDDLPKGR